MAEQVVISPAVKFLFFSLLKSKKQFKDMKREAGKINFVTIIISPPATMFLRVKPETGEELSKPFKESELKNFLRALNVKEETVKEIKHIFILLDMNKRTIKFDQTNKDGTKKEFTL